VRLLGELQAELDGRAVVAPAGRRVWALLAWLALHPGEHPRSAVAARFWPDVLDTSARASLRNAAWALRQLVGEALVAGRERIGVRCETDVAEFDAHVRTGRLEDAVALCRGPLLADFDDDWVLEARDEHAERLGAVLARLAAAAAAPAESVAWARRRLALDPLDEAAARDLMRRLAQAGDRAAALAAYDRLADRLRTALGLAPSAETRALAGAVREAEPAPAVAGHGDEAAHDDAAWAAHRAGAAHDGAAPAAPAPGEARNGAAIAPAAPATPSRAPFDDPALVGRDAELAALLGVWDHVRGGRGAVVLIGGEAGIGKSRLAAELVARARGARAATCTALDLGGAPPFGPWAELLATLARELAPPPADAGWPEELARLAPSLPRRLGRAPAPAADVPPDLARARMFEGAVELAEHATADRPLVLVFDDAHLADAPSLELAAYLARRIAQLPVLLVLTRRTEPRRGEIDGLAHAARSRGVAVCELELAPLALAEVRRLVGHGAPERMIAAADGNPLLALESARAAALGEHGPPPSLRALVRAAVAGLGEPARRAAELTAAAGRELDRAELAALAPPEAVVAALDCGLFRSADGRFGFRHALLREAVYADLDDARRRLAHERLGEALRGAAAEAARHLRLAGRDDLAADRLVQAAGQARRATAFEDAARFLAEAVELRPGDAAARLELAGAHALLGHRDDASTQLEAALELIAPREKAAALLDAARWYRSSLCDPPRVREIAQRGLDALGAAGGARGNAAARNERAGGGTRGNGAARNERGGGEERSSDELRAELLLIRAWAEVTMSGADAADGTLGEIAALDVEDTPLRRQDLENVRGFVALANGRLQEAEERLAEAGRLGERAERPDMAYGGWANAACVAAAAGRFGAALDYADHGALLTAGLPVVEFHMTGLRAYVLACLGRHDDARAETDRLPELAARLGSPKLAATADHDAGLLALMAGDYERAQRLLGRALENDPPVQIAEARLRRAEALARLNRPDEADAEIRAAALEPVRPSHRPAVLVARMTFAQALSARARGDHALAERRLHEADAQWRRLGGERSGGERAARDSATRDYMASLVDLGRPPVTGVVDPAKELERVHADLR
jgi:DNA-binding SARP family transcriptional activator/tetratricopeptide (TPR) repeat protein